MSKEALKKYDDLALLEKRLANSVGARVRDKDRIESAFKKQDEIRKRHHQDFEWDSVGQIRKLRESR